MIEPISVVRKATRQSVVGSPKNSMPIAAVPNAPRPVHTAYAVPSDSSRVDRFSRPKLASAQMAKQTL